MPDTGCLGLFVRGSQKNNNEYDVRDEGKSRFWIRHLLENVNLEE